MKIDDFDRKIIRALRKRRPDEQCRSRSRGRPVGLGLPQAGAGAGGRGRHPRLHGDRPGDDEDGIVVIVQITPDRQSEDLLNQFEEAVRKHPEIRECFLMTGIADYVLRAEAAARPITRPSTRRSCRACPASPASSRAAIRAVLRDPGPGRDPAPGRLDGAGADHDPALR
jgi:DNA-binding Lrp family transcriptional regulator